MYDVISRKLIIVLVVFWNRHIQLPLTTPLKQKHQWMKYIYTLQHTLLVRLEVKLLKVVLYSYLIQWFATFLHHARTERHAHVQRFEVKRVRARDVAESV